jgi:hypothetical protein
VVEGVLPVPLVGETVPQPGEQAVAPWVRVQVTPAPLMSFDTVAVKLWVPLTTTLGDVGEIETDTPTMVAAAVPVLVKSDTEVAVIVTVAFAGTVAGAV